METQVVQTDAEEASSDNTNCNTNSTTKGNNDHDHDHDHDHNNDNDNDNDHDNDNDNGHNSDSNNIVTNPSSNTNTGSTTTITTATTNGDSRAKKRPRSPSEGEPTAAVSAASAAAAAQLSATMGWSGLYSLLSVSALTSAANLPTVEQVQQAALKNVADCPPFVHLSKTDSAPQLKVQDERRLHVKGGMRGYRMARATHGITQGHYYFEVLILNPPKISEIAGALPSNVRLGPKLQQQLQEALQAEQQGNPVDPAGFGPHIRLGFSNRTGDLHAPVGYDKWSFAIRDIGGSRIHCSKRDDAWGGESFGPGDVIGCAISIVPRKEGPLPAATPSAVQPETNTTNQSEEDVEPANLNQIRFFKNGVPMGQLVNSKGKKEGAVAFYVPDGVYYPAVSLYMGASVKLNFGPYFICPPRKTYYKYKPVADLCERPVSLEDAIAKVQKEKVVRKIDMMQKFQELVATEVQVQLDSYTSHRKKHVQEIWKERQIRGIKCDDLEHDEYYSNEGLEVAEGFHLTST